MRYSHLHSVRSVAARISDLIAEGYTFEAKEERGDYVYRLVSRPAPKTVAMGL